MEISQNTKNYITNEAGLLFVGGEKLNTVEGSVIILHREMFVHPEIDSGRS